jgi:hypothetical protein
MANQAKLQKTVTPRSALYQIVDDTLLISVPLDPVSVEHNAELSNSETSYILGTSGGNQTIEGTSVGKIRVGFTVFQKCSDREAFLNGDVATEETRKPRKRSSLAKFGG